jgi:hypothetical protein
MRTLLRTSIPAAALLLASRLTPYIPLVLDPATQNYPTAAKLASQGVRILRFEVSSRRPAEESIVFGRKLGMAVR